MTLRGSALPSAFAAARVVRTRGRSQSRGTASSSSSLASSSVDSKREQELQELFTDTRQHEIAERVDKVVASSCRIEAKERQGSEQASERASEPKMADQQQPSNAAPYNAYTQPEPPMLSSGGGLPPIPLDAQQQQAAAAKQSLKQWWTKFTKQQQQQQAAAASSSGASSFKSDASPMNAAGGGHRAVFGVPLTESLKYAGVAISMVGPDGVNQVYGCVLQTRRTRPGSSRCHILQACGTVAKLFDGALMLLICFSNAHALINVPHLAATSRSWSQSAVSSSSRKVGSHLRETRKQRLNGHMNQLQLLLSKESSAYQAPRAE